MDGYLENLARLNNGAIQVEQPDGLPAFVVLAGPIKVWWDEGMWDSPAHREYVTWRDAVEAYLVAHGVLVYKPHTAWRGAWHEAAQNVNNEAIRQADALVVLTPVDGPVSDRTWSVPCQGTRDEMRVARVSNTRIFLSPPEPLDAQLALAILLDRIMDTFPDRVYKTV